MFRILLVLLTLCIALPCAADVVQPTYTGEYGNPEEPALRPYKWMVRGVKALFYQTGKGFADGNMATPVLGTVNTGRGLRKGTAEALESTWKGSMFAPVPEDRDYKELRNANIRIEDDPFWRNATDAAFTWYLYPVLKFNDHYPVENEEKVLIRKQRAKVIRAERRAAWDARIEGTQPESKVRRAQIHYVGERATYDLDKKQDYKGNILKLVK